LSHRVPKWEKYSSRSVSASSLGAPLVDGFDFRAHRQV
jgi:hypothetical protein